MALADKVVGWVRSALHPSDTPTFVKQGQIANWYFGSYFPCPLVHVMIFTLFKVVVAHKCYIVATCDRDLKRRIRKVPGVPIMFITSHKYSIERLPEATIGGAPRF